MMAGLVLLRDAASGVFRTDEVEIRMNVRRCGDSVRAGACLSVVFLDDPIDGLTHSTFRLPLSFVSFLIATIT